MKDNYKVLISHSHASDFIGPLHLYHIPCEQASYLKTRGGDGFHKEDFSYFNFKVIFGSLYKVYHVFKLITFVNKNLLSYNPTSTHLHHKNFM